MKRIVFMLALVCGFASASLREIKISKLAKQFLGFCVVCTGRIFGHRKQPQAPTSSFEQNPRVPLFALRPRMERYALETTHVGFASSTIACVLRIEALTKICASIIESIAIAMVSLFSRFTAQYQAMHSHFSFTVWRTQHIEASSSGIFIHDPIPLRKPLKIGPINNGILALREGNQSVGLVLRLDNRVSFNSAFHWSTSNGLMKFSRNFLIIAFISLCFSLPSLAQVQLLPWTDSQFFDSNGKPLAGGCVFTYASGTSTPLASYTDYTGSVVATNPVVLDSAGRGNIWLAGQAYRIRLVGAGGINCSTGSQIFQLDGINSSVTQLLSLNNVWSGSNTWQATSTFAGPVTFNLGFTSNGPSNLTLGGSLNGTFSGSPIFSGTPNFSNGFSTTDLTLSGQLISTLPTGTPPLVIASTTQVPNLNVSQLEGCTWEVPCPLGSTTPNSVAATTLNASTSLTLNGSTAQTGVQGSDVNLLSAGTVSGPAGNPLCTDANLGATTAGCAAGHVISLGTSTSVCSTTNSAGATCSTSVPISPNQVDTLYIANCTGVNPTQYPFIIGVNKGLTSITVTISNGSSSQAQISTFAELDCSAVHP